MVAAKHEVVKEVDHPTAKSPLLDEPRPINGRLRLACELLLQAYDYACELARSPWDFAVEITSLQDAGLTTSDLRWLACKDYVDHAREISQWGDEGREFRPNGRLTFSRRSCFVLTATGLEIARLLRDSNPKLNGHDPDPRGFDDRLDDPAYRLHDAAALDGRSPQVDPRPTPRPRWDCDRREIRLAGYLIKQFKLPSPNQETILMAFEEEGWPPRIDDPLPPHPECDPKQRLHDTIRSLNRNQKSSVIRFRGDGTGEGILWESHLLTGNGTHDIHKGESL